MAADGRGGTRPRSHRPSRRRLPRTDLRSRTPATLDDVVVEWTYNYGDGRLYRNVSIAELLDGQAIKVTDYWGEPATTPEWRRSRTDRLDMPADGIWKDAEHLTHH